MALIEFNTTVVQARPAQDRGHRCRNLHLASAVVGAVTTVLMQALVGALLWQDDPTPTTTPASCVVVVSPDQ